MDLATSEGARYARVCVEIDLYKPLLGKYIIGDRVLFVEYESLENICFNFGMYGHKEDRCPLLFPIEECNASPSLPPPMKATTDPEKEAGSWMTVSHRQRKKSKNLVSVPISYSEATFESLPVASQSVDKKKMVRDKVGRNRNPKVVLVITKTPKSRGKPKSYIPKPAGKDDELRANDGENQLLQNGRPPDPSC
ncbi:hypothetical protein LINPERHAP1_LOCUS24421 [Linum perenne]